MLPMFLQGSASVAIKMDQTVKAYESLQVTSVPGPYAPLRCRFKQPSAVPHRPRWQTQVESASDICTL